MTEHTQGAQGVFGQVVGGLLALGTQRSHDQAIALRGVQAQGTLHAQDALHAVQVRVREAGDDHGLLRRRLRWLRFGEG